METLAKVVDATLVIELFIWYIIIGILIAAWACFYLALAAAKLNTTFLRIFGVLLFFCILWLGVVTAYEDSYGFSDTINILSLLVPIVMLTAQIVICAILVVFRKKGR